MAFLTKGTPLRPTGTVTFLFTDIEGSTRLWEKYPGAMQAAFSRQESIIRQAMSDHGGYIYKMIGDAFQVAFTTAQSALAAALEAQRALHAEPWGDIGCLKVRMALHVGVTEERGDDYVGPELNRVARILNAGHGGQVLLSQSVYELLRDHLLASVSLRDLGLLSLKDLFHPEHLYQAIAPDLPKDFPPLRTVERRPNLPLQATPFVGRETELQQIELLLDNPDCRLITLIGIGGSGKTRLAVQAAGQSQVFKRNIYFVGLAGITMQDDLIFAIAEAVGFVFQAPPRVNLSIQEAQPQLLQYLSDKRALMVLDNFEQLVDFTGFIDSLLSAAPELKLLVTSRERLNLPGEWVIEVTGLAFPGTRKFEFIPQYAAVQLFVKVAERTGYSPINIQDWPAISQICHLLEGIPLFIEMASALTKMLSCSEIAAEIERDLDFLAASWRGIPERHRTLRSVFEYSWRQLPDEEVEVFCGLAVFQGGFSREAAQEVVDAPLALLMALVDKSLIRRVSSGYFDVHPVLKQYAAEKLAERADTQIEMQTRYARYYSKWMGRMFERLKGKEQLAALTALRAETQNLRSAWQILINQRDFISLERVLPALMLFYEMNNQPVEAQEVVRLFQDTQTQLRQSLQAEIDTHAADALRYFYQGLLAITLAALKHFTVDPNQPVNNAPYMLESLQLAQELPDCFAKAFVILTNFSNTNLIPSQIPPQQSIEYCRQCIAIFQRLGDTWGAALALLILADNYYFFAHDATQAQTAYRSSLEYFSNIGNDWGQALCLSGLAYLAEASENLEEAYHLRRQALETFNRLGNTKRILDSRQFLGEIAIRLGWVDDARNYFEINLEYYTQAGDDRGRKYYLDRLEQLDNPTE